MLDAHTDAGLSLLMLTNLTRNGFTSTSLTLLVITVIAASFDMAISLASILLPVLEDTYYLQTVLSILVCEAVVLVTTAVALRQHFVTDVEVSGGELGFLIMSGLSTVSTFLVSLWSLRTIQKVRALRQQGVRRVHPAVAKDDCQEADSL